MNGLMGSLRWIMLACFLMLVALPPAMAEDNSHKGESIQMMESFEKQASHVEDENVFNDHKKRVIMFLMGVPLLILILITGALGIAMVVYGKQVFTLHMVFAGLTITLAVTHLVTGLVWFFPF